MYVSIVINWWPLQCFYFVRGLMSLRTIAMLTIMKIDKGLFFFRQVFQVVKAVYLQEFFLIGIIEFLNHSVSPWFTYWYKNNCNTLTKYEANHAAKASWVSITTPKGQFVIHL